MMLSASPTKDLGFSLTELLAAVAVIAVVAMVIIARCTAGSSASKTAACEVIQGDIEVQCELWRHNTGAWPSTNLSDIGASIHYFPSGVPLCPATGSTYSIDSAGQVVGHNH
jgi:prepilin-type N-terminal cleavage/methylation domain-containing protein